MTTPQEPQPKVAKRRRRDGVDDAPARGGRRPEHELPAVPPLHRGGGTEHRLEIFGRRWRDGSQPTLSSRFGYDVPVLGQIPDRPVAA